MLILTSLGLGSAEAETSGAERRRVRIDQSYYMKSTSRLRSASMETVKRRRAERREDVWGSTNHITLNPHRVCAPLQWQQSSGEKRSGEKTCGDRPIILHKIHISSPLRFNADGNSQALRSSPPQWNHVPLFTALLL